MDVTQGKSVRDRAYAKAIEILENHEPYPLPGNASETMKEIVDAYELELKKEKKA
jgi:trimethylamine:corrinoid methyltransferase-like protein